MFSILLDEQIDGLESNPPGLSVPNSPGPDEQSQEDVVTLTCIICSKQFEITQDLPDFSTVCSSCMFNSEESQRQSLIMKSLECCFDGCALDQFGPCRLCKSAFCEDHIGQHDCEQDKTTSTNEISQDSVMNEATVTDPADVMNEATVTNPAGLIPEISITAGQDLLSSQEVLHSFLNSLTYERSGNYN